MPRAYYPFDHGADVAWDENARRSGKRAKGLRPRDAASGPQAAQSDCVKSVFEHSGGWSLSSALQKDKGCFHDAGCEGVHSAPRYINIVL